MLKSLQINNLLSFGPKSESVSLRPLNVLVGPNGSGKSNFLSAIRILQRIPDDVSQFWKSANQPDDWFWSGNATENISLIVSFDEKIVYVLMFEKTYNEMTIDTEIIKTLEGGIVISRSGFNYQVFDGRVERDLVVSNSLSDKRKSVLSQYRDSQEGIAALQSSLTKIKIYSERPHGDRNFLRNPQSIDVASDFLSEQFDNLPVVLHELNNKISIEALLLDKLQRFYPRVEKFYMGLVGPRAQVFFQERVGNRLMNVPASRLSDGTLSFLCLLTILCHPTPPPLICIEEPELGLHPDVLPMIAELLVEASKRTQLIITTHSDLLVSAIGDLDPEAILVCEHTAEEGTTIERPNPERLKKWLQQDEMSLGEVWLRGAIGGTLY
nr:AAA family ATPase [Armatimonas sp.]